MASNLTHFLFFLLLFHSYLLHLPLRVFSLISDSETDYQKWVIWNSNEYRKKAVFAAEAVAGSRKSALDVKLRKAEVNKMRVSVSQDGNGDYKSIREAVDSIPINNTRRVILQIKPGVYREKIVIPKSMAFVTFLGDAENPPTVTWNDTALVLGKDGLPLTTFHSATVAINADYFLAFNVKFENTAPYPEVGTMGGQAVALRISGNKAAFYNCSFYGSQDTLYDHKGLHYYSNCFIQGSVDFIFGYGRSLYENCYLNSITKSVASLTAQKRTNASLSSGFSFMKSVISGSGLVYLGRPWGDHSRVVFSYTYMGPVVIPQGWNNWGVQHREMSVYYGEYKCIGPGSNITGRVHWARVLSDEEAKPFIGTYYVDGDKWLLGYQDI